MAAADAKRYVIQKRGDQYCLLTRDGRRVLGCHDSEAGAQAQERAIEASKHADHAELHQIKAVEIFKSGRWNGDDYSDADLDRIVEASAQVGFGVPLKAGHKDTSGEPALGWVENLRRDGGRLLADLTHLPERVFEAIKDRAYDSVSAEIFWDLERNGVKYPRALKALALLGAEIPAVDLAPLRSSLALNAVLLPPRLEALVYATELKLNEAASPAGREAHHDEAMTMEPEKDGSCPEGYEKGEDGRCHLKKKAMTQTAYLSREFVAEICPSCAEAMRAKKITRLTIARGADGGYDFGPLKQYAGFSEALCEKYGAAEGFRTRCMDSMGGNVDDPGAFCNALKDWCGLMSAKGGEVHTTTESTPMATAATKTPDPQDAPVRDGEIVVRMSEIAELRRKAEKAEKLESLQTNLLAEKAQHEALLEQQRADRLTYKLRDVKLPVFRPYIRALYEIAQGAPSVKQYTVADRQADAEGIVELLVLELNKQAEHLFATLSVVDLKKRDPDEPEDTQGKIAYRVNAYCRAQKLDPRRDYKAAVEAVLAADPDLKRDYAAL